ncbi:hypothetical protein SNEBB_000999 [Seison nebaliae]|nr:hypothetical protein SNEBB_000999 [Seison nebaliae]
MTTTQGLQSAMIMDSNFLPIRMTNMTNSQSVSYASMLQQLKNRMDNIVRTIDSSSNQLKLCRLCTQNNEIVIAPDKDFTIICIYANDEITQPMFEGHVNVMNAKLDAMF